MMEAEKLEKQKRFLIRAAYWVLLCTLLYVTFKYGLSLIAPFVVGFVMALIVKPVVDYLNKRCRFPRTAASVLMVVTLYLVLGGLLALAVVQLVSMVQDVLNRAPVAYTNEIQPAIAGMFDWVERMLQRFDPKATLGIDDAARKLSDKLGEIVRDLSTWAVTGTARFATSIPTRMVQMLFAILSTFYIVNDYTLIKDFIIKQLPAKAGQVLERGKDQLGKTLGRYIRSYGIILCITFAELTLGLSILRIPNAGWWALLIACFDILPVLGTSAVMVPWTVITILQGNYARAIGLAVITAVVWTVRNIVEPKIVGTQVGLHPLLTLMAMYVGTKLFGGFGLLGLPVALALINALQKEGTIQVYK
ncbi:MAG: sporulation integral membrane protein YtvI [Clostridia bacterium]|nr:sporulation integral membrane protein YtvI [Clostridia bacterium]